MLSTDRLREVLKEHGIEIARIAADPRTRESAIAYAYKAIPIPLRWIIGRKRVSKAVDSLVRGAERLTAKIGATVQPRSQAADGGPSPVQASDTVRPAIQDIPQELEMPPMAAPCPLCGVGIDIANVSWECPACETINANCNILSNCKRCKFSPRLMDCSSCHQPFENLLLMGSFEGRSMKVVPYKQVRDLAQEMYELCALEILTIGTAGNNLDGVDEEVIGAMANTPFQLPITVTHFVVHTVERDAAGVQWMHGWLHRSASDCDGTDPAAQLSARYPSRSGDGADVMVTDVLMVV